MMRAVLTLMLGVAALAAIGTSEAGAGTVARVPPQLAAAPVGAAVAVGTTLRDGNDTPGALDIARLSQGHSGSSVTALVTTYGAWRARVLGPKTGSIILLRIDSSDGPRPERWIAIVEARGALRGFVLNGRANRVLARARVTRPGSRSARVTVSRAAIGASTGYRWAAYTVYQPTTGPCRGGCVDRAPNRGGFLHDLRPPVVDQLNFPAISTDVSATLDYPVSFRVSDTAYDSSGFSRWTLQRKPLGSSVWTVADQGTSAGGKTRTVTGVEGHTVRLRVVARDRHGNVTISPGSLVSVPFDDATLASDFTGTWTADTNVADRFLGTRHTSGNTGDTFTYTFTGTFFAWIGSSASAGNATVTVDGGPPQTVDTTALTGPREVMFQTTLASVPHTVVIAPGTATIEIDGIVSR